MTHRIALFLAGGQLCSPTELLDQLSTYTGKFEVLLGSPDAVARELKLRPKTIG